MLQENKPTLRTDITVEDSQTDETLALEPKIEINWLEAECLLKFSNQPVYVATSGNQLICNCTWDGVSCWPPTLGGTLSSVPCFKELKGVLYDSSRNASRECFENGTWSKWSNYRSCKPVSIHEDDEFIKSLWDVKEAATIYYVGYSFSLLAITIALLIFIYFRDLRCLRNTIHTNLLATYLLIDITWILTATLQSSHNHMAEKVACVTVILLTYLLGTNFFWMFVEGLYLYLLVVKTFSIDKVKFKAYVLIGWGLPALVVAAWAGLKWAFGQTGDDPFMQRGCPWQNRDFLDYVFICPVVLVLIINIFFLACIMWILITKLRASSTAESQQYRKAAKALLVLIPLLGVTYILVIATPQNPMAEVIFTYIQTTLLSIQGFIVSVLYCFLNGEVQNSLRHHFARWRTQTNVGRSPRKSLGNNSTQHGETIRLYSSSKAVRGSCTSFTTTTSIINTQNRSPNSGHTAAQEDML